jgi:hypothetical protein
LVAVFSARGATKEGIIEAAKEDYRVLNGILEPGARLDYGPILECLTPTTGLIHLTA